VHPLDFVVPIYGHGRRGREAMAGALWVGNLLSAGRNDGLPMSHRIRGARMLSPREVLDDAPGIDARSLTGGAGWTDAQASSSERLLIGFLHAAAQAGAVLASRVEVTGLRQQDGRGDGARACRGRGSGAFPWAGLDRSEGSRVHRGLVPGRGGAAGLASRGRIIDHEAEDGRPGLVSIQAVKYTTARASAEKAVDLVVRR